MAALDAGISARRAVLVHLLFNPNRSLGQNWVQHRQKLHCKDIEATIYDSHSAGNELGSIRHEVVDGPT